LSLLKHTDQFIIDFYLNLALVDEKEATANFSLLEDILSVLWFSIDHFFANPLEFCPSE
jgi:hypothetical protein